METIPRNDFSRQHRFDAFCKAVLRNEAKDYLRELGRQRDREKSLEALTQQELNKKFMDEVCLKKNPEIPDKMFGFGFNGKQDIRQTRGYAEERDMTPYLIENRIEEIANSFR